MQIVVEDWVSKILACTSKSESRKESSTATGLFGEGQGCHVQGCLDEAGHSAKPTCNLKECPDGFVL